MSAVVTRARREVTPTPDAQLVAAFAQTGDAEAFAELVRRHGSMVLGVCRKITRHAHDAEDAAQAAFLVLARRAGSIQADSVASWLYGVAVNTARAARRKSARRREALSACVPEFGRFDSEPDFDTRAVIAEELAKLPDRYRELVVRCDLEGESQATVARRSGLPVGTVYSRLSTARAILAGRLTQRGIAAGVAVLAVPRGSKAFVVSDCPSARVKELTEAVMRTGIGVKAKWMVAAMLTAGVALGAFGKADVAEAPAPRPADESKITILRGSRLEYLSPNGTRLSRVTAHDAKEAGADIPTMNFTIGLTKEEGLTAKLEEMFTPHGRPAPDGRIPLATKKGLYLFTPGGKAEPVKAAGDVKESDAPSAIAWSPDGKRALFGISEAGGYFSKPKAQHAIFDIAAGTGTEVTLPPNHRAIDWSPEGAWFLTIRDTHRWTLTNGWQTEAWVLCFVSADGRQVKELSDSKGLVFAGTISPDGKSIVFMDFKSEKVTKPNNEEPVWYSGFELVVINLTTGTKRTVVSEKGGMRDDGMIYHAMPGAVRWSPDSTRIAFAYDHNDFNGKLEAGKWQLQTSEWRLKTIALDGTDAKTVMTIDRKPDGEKWRHYQLIDWR